jgi:hypothetical protein
MKKFMLICLCTLVCTITSAEEKLTTDIIVYKSPACGCCTKWASHLRENGLSVTEVNVEDVSLYKRQYGVPSHLGACHTALAGDYVVEGHVPAVDILRLLEQRPDIEGLTVPGMPLGSPGMEMGDTVHPYEVLAIQKDGSVETFNSYPGR